MLLERRCTVLARCVVLYIVIEVVFRKTGCDHSRKLDRSASWTLPVPNTFRGFHAQGHQMVLQ